VSGGTDNHLFLLHLIDKNITGKDADAALARAHITVNKNAVAQRPASAGHQAADCASARPPVTTRGSRSQKSGKLTNWIADVLDTKADESAVERARAEVVKICRQFPVYGLVPEWSASGPK